MKTGTNNTYNLTGLENIGSGLVTAPSYNSSLAADANPEIIYFK